jgi:hypothetical protein
MMQVRNRNGSKEKTRIMAAGRYGREWGGLESHTRENIQIKNGNSTKGKKDTRKGNISIKETMHNVQQRTQVASSKK